MRRRAMKNHEVPIRTKPAKAPVTVPAIAPPDIDAESFGLRGDDVLDVDAVDADKKELAEAIVEEGSNDVALASIPRNV